MIKFENFLEESEVVTVQSILSQQNWGFGFISNDSYKPIWNFDKKTGKQIVDILMTRLPDYKLLDYHINGQTVGLHGSPHQDNANGCTHALVYFPFPWEYTWGGRLHIQNGPVVITPQYNFAVLFDSSIFHYAEAPTVSNVLRISIGLKLKKSA